MSPLFRFSNPVSRIAPTPSGYLHIGNAFNFLLTRSLMDRLGGKLHLRIDDMDQERTKAEYVEDIFYSLDWLGIGYDKGPSGPDDFYKNYTQQKKRGYYFDLLYRFYKETDGLLYACGCSRRQAARCWDDGIYRGLCREKGAEFEAGRDALRIKVLESEEISFNSRQADSSRVGFSARQLTLRPGAEMGDFVLWRKEDTPSYQWVSLVEDTEAGVNLIVRGEDLLLSTAAQIYLSSSLGFGRFASLDFFHHRLLADDHGQKLSKSSGSTSLKALRAKGISGKEVRRRLGFL